MAKKERPAKEELGGLFTPISKDYNTVTFQIPGDVGRFLGKMERNELAILLRGDKGAGKSRFTYQMMNAFGAAGFTVANFSLEMSKSTDLVKRMRNEYISPDVVDRIQMADELPNGIKDIYDAAKQFDIVVIDSWTKVPGVERDTEALDKLRKANPKTIFIIIIQSNSKGTAKGGPGSEYDAGIVIQINKEDDGRGLAVCEKNRYSADNHVFSVFEKKLVS